MYNAYTSGMGLPGNVPTMFERTRGPHFSGAPPASFNVGPSSGAGMSIFSSTPSGELMGAASDDSLFAPAVAPVTRAYAVVSGTEKQHMWLPKGMVVQISEFHVGDPLGEDETARQKAERAGHNLKRLLCEHCPTHTVRVTMTVPDAVNYASEGTDGVVGVLAEAVDVGKAALKLKGGYAVVTVALENAAEVFVPPDLTTLLADEDDEYKGAWTGRLQTKAPAQPITLQARKDLPKFRAATVLAEWTLGDAVGIQACLHPQIYTAALPDMTDSTLDMAGAQDDAFAASRWHTQAAMAAP